MKILKYEEVPAELWNKLAVGRRRAVKRSPYFAKVLLALVAQPVRGLGTWGTSKDMIMTFDVEWTATLTDEQIEFLFWHESMHIINNFFRRIGSRDAMTFNVAQDIFINDTALQVGFRRSAMPDEPCLSPAYGFPPNLTCEEYYDLLVKEKEDGKGGQQSNEGRPKCAGGWCGGAAGNPHPNEPKSGDVRGGEAESAIEGRTEAEVARVVKEVAADIAARQQSRGDVPAGLRIAVELGQEKPQVRWQDKLARACRHSMAYKAGAIDFRQTGRSRRQAGLGFGIGKPITPQLVAPVPKVLVIRDTSGSMTVRNRLKLALVESFAIVKAVGGEVTMMDCDAKVHQVKKVRNAKELLKMDFVGGGGTSFIPAFEAVAKMRDKPNVIIFATDLDGYFPDRAPRGINVIWLATDPYQAEVPWGELVVVT